MREASRGSYNGARPCRRTHKQNYGTSVCAGHDDQTKMSMKDTSGKRIRKEHAGTRFKSIQFVYCSIRLSTKWLTEVLTHSRIGCVFRRRMEQLSASNITARETTIDNVVCVGSDWSIVESVAAAAAELTVAHEKTDAATGPHTQRRRVLHNSAPARVAVTMRESNLAVAVNQRLQLTNGSSSRRNGKRHTVRAEESLCFETEWHKWRCCCLRYYCRCLLLSTLACKVDIVVAVAAGSAAEASPFKFENSNKAARL